MADTLHSAEENAKAFALYKTLPLADLRRRQRICKAQIAAWQERHGMTTLENMQTMATLLMHAIDYICFEKK